MTYKALTKRIELNNLTEGEAFDRIELLSKLKTFEAFDPGAGFYIADRRYKEYGEIGLHYYKYTTIIKILEKAPYTTSKLKPRFSDRWLLSFEEVAQ